jgi:hypothetical protein
MAAPTHEGRASLSPEMGSVMQRPKPRYGVEAAPFDRANINNKCVAIESFVFEREI